MRVTAFVVLLCGVLALAPGGTTAWLGLDRRATLAGEAWRLWSGHLVHFSPAHVAVDVVALACVGAVAERELGAAAMAGICGIGAPLLSLVLLLAAPGMALYAGASGLAALLAGAAGASLWRRSPRLRGSIALLGGIALVRTALDATGWSPGGSSLPDGVRVAWQAHGAGVTLGIAAAWLVRPARVGCLPQTRSG